MNPLSITANVFTIIEISDRVASVCKHYINAFRDYPKELYIIFIETKSLVVICEGLQLLLQDNVNEAAIIARLAGSDGPIAECEKTIKQLEILLPPPPEPPNNTQKAKLRSALDALAWTRKSDKAKTLLQNP